MSFKMNVNPNPKWTVSSEATIFISELPPAMGMAKKKKKKKKQKEYLRNIRTVSSNFFFFLQKK